VKCHLKLHIDITLHYIILFILLQVKTRDWVKCEKSGKIYESTLKILKVCSHLLADLARFLLYSGVRKVAA